MKLFLISACLIILLFKQIQNVNITLFMKDAKNDKKITKIFSRLLHKFRTFQIIFHADSETILYVENVIKYFTYSDQETHATVLTNFLIYNHDKLIISRDSHEPKVSNNVNILLSNKNNLWSSLSAQEKVTNHDIVLIFSDTDINLRSQILAEGKAFVQFAGKVLILEAKTHKGISIYTICYYCGNMSMEFQLVEKIRHSKIITKRTELMPSKFRDLNGHLFNIVFITYFPYIVCQRPDKDVINGKEVTKCGDIIGVESELIKVISEKLNFKYQVHMMAVNDSFLDMIKYISNRKADIAIGGISITADRIPLVQFTKPFSNEDFTFLYMFNLSFKEMFNKFLEPFSEIIVWIIYAAIFSILILILYITLKINTHNRYEEVSIYDAIWVLLRMVLEQSNPNINYISRHRLSIALILSFWWWACIIINTVYKSTIMSVMVNPSVKEPANFEQLLQAGYGLVGNAQFADVIKDLLLVPDPLYREGLNKLKYGEDTCDVFDKVLNNRVAMLDEISTMLYEIRTLCPEPPPLKRKWLRIGRNPVRYTGHAWATQRGAPYRQAIDHYLALVLSGGHFMRWTEDIITSLHKNQIYKSGEIKNSGYRRMSMKRIMPLITIYSILISVAILCFIGELLTYFLIKQISRLFHPV